MSFISETKRRVKNVAHNLDRAVASVFGAEPEATIGSSIHKHKDDNKAAKIAADVIDDVKPPQPKA